jgi:hypothetical protein
MKFNGLVWAVALPLMELVAMGTLYF